jgi:hypothetical protein
MIMECGVQFETQKTIDTVMPTPALSAKGILPGGESQHLFLANSKKIPNGNAPE